jgi:hypothetical protein
VEHNTIKGDMSKVSAGVDPGKPVVIVINSHVLVKTAHITARQDVDSEQLSTTNWEMAASPCPKGKVGFP